jgi:PfaB family protein
MPPLPLPLFDHDSTLSVVGLHAAWGGSSGLQAAALRVFNPASVETNAAGSQAPGHLREWVRAALADAGLDPDRSSVTVLALASSSADLPADIQPIEQPAGPAVNRLAAALSAASQALKTSPPGAAVVLVEDLPGWGGSALVLQAAQAAALRSVRVYARLAAPVEAPVPLMADQVANAAARALQAAGLAPKDIAYVEMTALGKRPAAVAETAGLVRAFRTPGLENSCAIGTLGSVPTGTPAEELPTSLAALVKVCLCLHQRIFPAVPGWSGPALPAVWAGSPFYAPVDSRAWFDRPAQPRRIAALSSAGPGFSLLVLAEPATQPYAPTPALERSTAHLFPISADSLDGLLQQARELNNALAQPVDFAALAQASVERTRLDPDAAYTLALVGQSAAEVQREAELALKALPAAFANQREWQTPAGSCFTPMPVGRTGGVAFVYPGAFNSYPGVGKDLFFLFPELQDRLEYLAADLGKMLCGDLIYPRSLALFNPEALAEIEARLNADPIAMLASGTTLAVIYTRILRDSFGIHPQAGFGYSLGENSMMFAMGVWGEGESPYTRLDSSPCFHTRLAGPQNAVRRAWGLPEVPAGEGADPLWSSFVLMARPDDVRAALQSEPRVYLTHINTPRQVVIAGDPEGCRRVIAALKCQSLKAPFEYALHCDAMRSEQDELAYLHTWPVLKAPDARLYTAAGYTPVVFDASSQQASAQIAANIATALCTPLDFPRLVNAAYADGARVFIELGAGSNCARWVDESLKDRPHASLSINRRGSGDDVSLVRLLARLCTQRVPLNLGALYGARQSASSPIFALQNGGA